MENQNIKTLEDALYIKIHSDSSRLSFSLIYLCHFFKFCFCTSFSHLNVIRAYLKLSQAVMSNEIFGKKKKKSGRGRAQLTEARSAKDNTACLPVVSKFKKNKKNVNRLTDDGKVEIITCHCKRGFCANTAVELQNPFRNVIAI